MTKRISSPSASSTIKEKAERVGISGPPPEVTEPYSASTSKRWYVTFSDGRVVCYDVFGEDGRISFSASHGEVRIYRNASTKVYDAVLTGVQHVQSEYIQAREVFPSGSQRDELDWRPTPAQAPIPFDLMDPIAQEEIEAKEDKSAS